MPLYQHGRSFDDSDVIRVQNINLPGVHSISFWIYTTYTGTSKLSFPFRYKSLDTASSSSGSDPKRFMELRTNVEGTDFSNYISFSWRHNNSGSAAGDNVIHRYLKTNDYYHVCITRSSSTLNIYVNGSLSDTDSVNYNPGTSTNQDTAPDIWFGDKEGDPSSSYFNGHDLFDMRVYDRVLSSSEVQNIYNAGAIDTSPITNGLEGRWFIGDDDLLDKSGTGNHGVKYSPSWVTDTTQASIIIPSTPVATSPTGNSLGATYFDASWSTTSDDDSYRLDASTASNFSSFLSGYEDLTVSSPPVRLTGLSDNTVYYYRVRAIEDGVTGPNSNVVTVTTNAFSIPSVPTADPVTETTLTSFLAEWSTTDLDTTSFRLDVSLDPTFNSFVTGYQNLTVSSPHPFNPSANVSFNVTGLTQFTNYYFRVRGHNSAGSSSNSNVISAYTEENVFGNANYSNYLLNSLSDVAQLETIEISHPNFASTHYFVRNHTSGVTVTLENNVSQAFSYLPMKITEQGTGSDLDFGLLIEFGDLGEFLPNDLDAVASANALFTEPTLIYRTYRSDDLTSPMVGPIQLSVNSFSFNENGATFEAGANNSNSQRTGELYTISRFPMLRAFI